MLKIPLLVLALQIGLNTALTNPRFNSNLLSPSARFVNSGQTRRLADFNNYVSLSSRGIPTSDSEQSDSEYYSSEDYSFRSGRPIQSLSNQRRNDYLRSKNRPINYVSHNAAPVGRIYSNNYANSLQTSPSLSRRIVPNFRRPYLRRELSNLKHGPTRKYYSTENDDLSLEVSSLESNPEDALSLGDEASYLRSLLSLIELPKDGKELNTEFYKKNNNLSLDMSPIDKLEANEESVDSLPDYPARNYRKEFDIHEHNKRIHEPFPTKDIPDAYIDTILLVTDDDQPDEIPIGRPKIASPELTGFNRRQGNGLNFDDDISNNLSPFRGLKPRLKTLKLNNDSPLTRKFNRKSNKNAGLEILLNDELFPGGDNTAQLTVLRLASLEDLNLKSSSLRSRNQKGLNNRKSNHRKFLRLALSPDNKITLDEGVASDLSDLFSETLDELNLVPVNLSRTSNNQYSREKNTKPSADENNPQKFPILRLGSIDIPNAETSFSRYRKPVEHTSNRNLRIHENNKEAFRKLFDDDSPIRLVPYKEIKSNKLPDNRRNRKHYFDSKKDDFPDEFSLDTLFDFKKEDYDDILDLDNNFSDDQSILRSKHQYNLNLKPPFVRVSENESREKDTTNKLHLEYPWDDDLKTNNDNSHHDSVERRQVKSQLRDREEKDISNDSTNILYLEYPWNDQLGASENKTSGLRSKQNSKDREQNDNTKDTTIHLEYPWNDQLSPSENETGGLRSKINLRNREHKDNSKDSTNILQLEYPWSDQLSPSENKTSGLRSKENLRSDKQKNNTKDATDILHLEYPWNDQLSPNNKTSGLRLKENLRNPEDKDNTKDTTDILKLEYPWNDQLSPSENKTGTLRSKENLRDREQNDNLKDATNMLHLEYPWNDQLSPNDDKTISLSALRELKPDLKGNEQKDNTTDILHLQFPWNDPLSPDNNKTSSLSVLRELKSNLRGNEQKDDAKDSSDLLHLEFPWNDQLSADANKGKSQLRSHSGKENTTDTLLLEFPWNDQLRPNENRTGGLGLQSFLRSQSDNRQKKEPKDELKREFSWNDKTSPDKPSSKKTTVRTPDPFYVHPYLRNRNIKKHPNYFRRSYDEFTEGLRLASLKDKSSDSHLRKPNRKHNDNQSLRVLSIERGSSEDDTIIFRDFDEEISDVITLPLDRRPKGIKSRAEGTLPLVTTTDRPNDADTLNLVGDNTDKKTYNDSIIFPNN